MPKIRLPRVPLVSCIFLGLLITVIVFWSRSRSRAEILGFFTPKGHLQALANDRQGVLVFLSNVPFDPQMGLSAETMSSSADEFRELHDYLFDLTNEKGHFFGFRLASGFIGTGKWKFNALILPYWALVIPLAIPPLISFRRFFICVRRSRRGQCLNCGYDLRHSAVRCPECGKPFRVNEESVTAGLANVPPRKRIASFRRTVVFLLILTWAAIVIAVMQRRSARVTNNYDEQERAAGLDRRVRGIEFVELPLREAIRELSEKSGVNIVLDVQSLVAAKVEDDQEVDLRIDNATVREILEVILARIEPGTGVGYVIESRTIRVAADVDLPLVTRVYDVDDVVETSSAADTDVRTRCFGYPTKLSAVAETASEWAEQNIVAETDLHGWVRWPHGSGGARFAKYASIYDDGEIYSYLGRLVILQTPQHHRQIRQLLAAMQNACGMSPAGLIRPRLHIRPGGPFDPQ